MSGMLTLLHKCQSISVVRSFGATQSNYLSAVVALISFVFATSASHLYVIALDPSTQGHTALREGRGWLHGSQVETAVVQPLKDALTEEQWVQHNASLAAEAEAQKQAQEAAELERQLAEAEATQQQAAEAAEALRQSALTKVPSWALAARMHTVCVLAWALWMQLC